MMEKWVVSFQFCHSWATPAHPQPEIIMPMFWVCHSHYKEFNVTWLHISQDYSRCISENSSWLNDKCLQLSANHPSDPQRKFLSEELPFDELTCEPIETEFPHIHKVNTSRSIHGRLCLFRRHSMTCYYMSFGEGHLSHGCSWAGSIKSLFCSDSYLAVLLKKSQCLPLEVKISYTDM